MGDFEVGALASMESPFGYHSWFTIILTHLLTLRRTVLGGQFDWGGRLPKCNGGAQRYSQYGRKSYVERKCIRVLDCETYKSSRYESRD